MSTTRLIALLALSLPLLSAADRGSVLIEHWLGIGGTHVSDLTGDGAYPSRPHAVSVRPSFEAPTNWANDYGTRMRGWLHVDVTGTYRFWIAGDDQCELWLGTSADPTTKVRIAHVPEWTAPRQWEKFPEQVSAEILLEAGRYSIEALHKEGAGGDNLAVAWEGPAFSRAVIPGSHLSPVPVAIIAGGGEFVGSTTVTLTSSVPGAVIRYTRDGSAPDASSPLYSGPFAIDRSMVVRAILERPDGTFSEMATRSFLLAGDGTGLTGLYYANQHLLGTAIERHDPQIAFNWGLGAPMPDMPADQFSVRWLGSLEPRFDEPYTLIARTDDGVRVWLDGRLITDSWIHRSATNSTHTFLAQAGRRYALRVEAFEGTGLASAQLSWSSPSELRQVIPASQLYPATGTNLTIPTASLVSPAFVEGSFMPGLQPTATVGGEPLAISLLCDLGFWLDVPLHAETSVAVEVVTGSATVTGAIGWTPTPLDGTGTSVIRAGDSLLFAGVTAGSWSILTESGTERSEAAIADGELVPHRFARPGHYQVVAKNALGELISELNVTVVAVELPARLAAEVGHARPVTVPIFPAGTGEHIVLTGNDAGLLVVTPGATNAADIQIRAKPQRRGTPVLVARLGGEHGPILATRTIDEFTRETNAGSNGIVNADTQRAMRHLIMRPYIPDVWWNFDMFAHHATFAGGADFFRINTSGGPSTNGEDPFVQEFDPATGEIIGRFTFAIELPPGKFNACIRIWPSQINSPEQIIGQSSSYNPCYCKVKVGQIEMCEGEVRELPVEVTEACPEVGKQPIGTTAGSTGDSPPPISGTTEVDCAKLGPVTGVMVGSSTHQVGDGIPVGKYTVWIGSAYFEDVVWIRNSDPSGDVRYDPARVKACPLDPKELKAQLGNTGPCTETFDWVVTSDGDPDVTLANTSGSVTLAPGASTTITTTATVNVASPVGEETVTIKVSVRGQQVASASAFVEHAYTCEQEPTLEFTDKTQSVTDLCEEGDGTFSVIVQLNEGLKACDDGEQLGVPIEIDQYTWSSPNAVVVGNGSTATATFPAPGVYTVTVKVTGKLADANEYACSDPEPIEHTFTVTVHDWDCDPNNKPRLDLVGGDQSEEAVCESGDVTFSVDIQAIAGQARCYEDIRPVPIELIQYEWKVNGHRVDGANGSSLTATIEGFVGTHTITVKATGKLSSADADLCDEPTRSKTFKVKLYKWKCVTDPTMVKSAGVPDGIDLCKNQAYMFTVPVDLVAGKKRCIPVDPLADVPIAVDRVEVTDVRVVRLIGPGNGNPYTRMGNQIRFHRTGRYTVGVKATAKAVNRGDVCRLPPPVTHTYTVDVVDCNNEDCEEAEAPNRGVARGPTVICLDPPPPADHEHSVHGHHEETVFLLHGIVTVNTPRERDLHGVMKLVRKSGDASIVDIFRDQAPYALGSSFPVIEPGHSGCGIHDWHNGAESFRFVAKKPGVLVIEVSVDPNPDDGGDGVPTEKLTLTVFVGGFVDIDVDSDNNDRLGSPARSVDEEERENDPYMLGKLVMVNDGDLDLDGIPDYCDGFSTLYEPGDPLGFDHRDLEASWSFTPVVLAIHPTVELEDAEITLSYPDSDPIEVLKVETEFDPEFRIVVFPGTPEMRLWKKDGREPRNGRKANLDNRPGDYLPAGVYKPAQLGFTEQKRTITVWLEGINPGASDDIRIRMNLRAKPTGSDEFVECSDDVRVHVIAVRPPTVEVKQSERKTVADFIGLTGVSGEDLLEELFDDWRVEFEDEPTAFLLQSGEDGFVRLDREDDTKYRIPLDVSVDVLGGQFPEVEDDDIYSTDGAFVVYTVVGASIDGLRQHRPQGDIGLFRAAAVIRIAHEDGISEFGDPTLNAPYLTPDRGGGETLMGNKGLVVVDGFEWKPGLFVRRVDEGRSNSASSDRAVRDLGDKLLGDRRVGFYVAGETYGVTTFQAKALIEGEEYTVLDLPIIVQPLTANEPRPHQLQAAIVNRTGGLSAVPNIAADGSLPGEGQLDQDRLTISVDEYLYEHSLYMLAQVLPFNGREYDWHRPFEGSYYWNFYPSSSQAALTESMVNRIMSDGTSTHEQVFNGLLNGKGPAINLWRRMRMHVTAKEQSEPVPRDGDMHQKSTRDLELRASAFIDRAVLARLKRAFSLRNTPKQYGDIVTNLAGFGYHLPATVQGLEGLADNHISSLDATKRGYFPEAYAADAGVILHRDSWTTFFSSLIPPWNYAIEEVFDRPIAYGWRFGHPFTEDVLNFMILERMRFVRELNDRLLTLMAPTSPQWPIRAVLIGESDASGIIDFPGARVRWQTSIHSLPVHLDRADLSLRVDGIPGLNPNQLDWSVIDSGWSTNLLDYDYAFRFQVPGSLNWLYYQLAFSPSEAPETATQAETVAAALALAMHEANLVVQLLGERPYAAFFQQFRTEEPLGYLAWMIGDAIFSLEDLGKLIYGEDLITGRELSVLERMLSGGMVAISLSDVAFPAAHGVVAAIKTAKAQGFRRAVALSSQVRPPGAVGEVVQEATEGAGTWVSRHSSMHRATGGTVDMAHFGVRGMNEALDAPIARAALKEEANHALLFHIQDGADTANKSLVVSHNGYHPDGLVPGYGTPAAERRLVQPGRQVDAPTTAAAARDYCRTIEIDKVGAQLIADGDEDLWRQLRLEDGGCFAAGTLVVMADGTCKAIERVAVGEHVWSRNEDDALAPVRVAVIERTHAIMADRVLAIRFIEDGGGSQVLRTSTSHPFFVIGSGWREASSLLTGDKVRTAAGSATVVAIASEGGSRLVYNLTVESSRTFFVIGAEADLTDALWVHNTCKYLKWRDALGSRAREVVARWHGIGQSAVQERHFVSMFLEKKRGIILEEFVRTSPRFSRKVVGGRTVYQNLDDFDPAAIPQGFVLESKLPQSGPLREMIMAGKSNVELMKRGYAPIGKDGLPINLHHITGREPGPMAELMQSEHQFFHRELHRFRYDKGRRSFRCDPELDESYELFAGNYWRKRAKDLEGQ